MIFSIAWKNVWRNKLRSLIVILAVCLGLIGGVFYLAFANGMAQQQVDTAISTEISNIQIHNPKFLVNDETKYTIPSHNIKMDRIKSVDGVKSVSSRILSRAMASSAETGTGVMIYGINAENEKSVTNLFTKTIEGDYFETKTKKPIFIGKKLAEKLDVRLKSKVVITLQNMNGDLSYGAFRVVGIFKTENTNFDQGNVFVKHEDLTSLLGMQNGGVNEIAVLLTHNDITDTTASKIKNLFSAEIQNEKLIVRTWKEVQPALQMLNEMTIQFSMIFVGIILVALSFGIINTMLMAIMERVREIGMLMAIGMNKIKIFLMIMLETIFLSITGGIVGLIFSWIIIEITGRSGIDLSAVAEGLNSMGYGSFVYPEIANVFYILIALLVVITAMLASIIPAVKALKFIPAEAVRHEV